MLTSSSVPGRAPRLRWHPPPSHPACYGFARHLLPPLPPKTVTLAIPGILVIGRDNWVVGEIAEELAAAVVSAAGAAALTQPVGRTFTDPSVLQGIADGAHWADARMDPSEIEWTERQARAAIPSRS